MLYIEIQKATTLYNADDDCGNVYARMRVMSVEEYNPADYMDYEVIPSYVSWVNVGETLYKPKNFAIKMVNKTDPEDCILIMDPSIGELVTHRQATAINMVHVIERLGSPYNPQELEDEIAYWDAWNEADDLLADLDCAIALIERFEDVVKWYPNIDVESARAELEAIGAAPDVIGSDDPDYINKYANDIYDYVQAVKNWFYALEF